jgi:hypothetical protein
MNRKPSPTLRSILMAAVATAAIASFSIEAAASEKAASEPQAAGSVGGTVTVTTTVEDIDLENRMVTLKDEKGELTTLKIDESVKNLPQVKKGDHVTATYYESVAYEVNKPGRAMPGVTESESAVTAKPGEKPAAGASRVVQLTATVEAIDTAASTVTLKGPKGRSVKVKVRDPKKLEGVTVGDLVDITYTQALAISVTAAP